METKIEAFWRDATAGDVAKVMKGEKVEARFRDDKAEPWNDQRLAGWVEGLEHQWRSAEVGGRYNFCQVYEPQQWYLDKPDPGKGWRLLKKFPDEPKLATDEAWDCHSKEWRKTRNNDGDQAKAVWYRRRIGPNPPEKLDSCVDHLEVGKEYKLPNGHSIKITNEGFELE